MKRFNSPLRKQEVKKHWFVGKQFHTVLLCRFNKVCFLCGSCDIISNTEAVRSLNLESASRHVCRHIFLALFNRHRSRYTCFVRRMKCSCCFNNDRQSFVAGHDFLECVVGSLREGWGLQNTSLTI